ncbi:expansin-like A2 [Carex littledalei]|uniref:Expansin-like A2 n=1 Tax=Carex littledalei TaxID=544730 RepID=A0A833QP87_9POAL|nr:expansin-like A2 [Carex littledalei]
MSLWSLLSPDLSSPPVNLRERRREIAVFKNARRSPPQPPAIYLIVLSYQFSDLYPVGACRYGAMATQLYNGYIAAAGPALFREGDSCGNCFEVFVLSKKAFIALGIKGMAHDLMQHRNLDVEFRRTPCEYNKNLSIRVEERSRKPGHLTIKFLYQGGQTDVMAVEVAQFTSPEDLDGENMYRCERCSAYVRAVECARGAKYFNYSAQDIPGQNLLALCIQFT